MKVETMTPLVTDFLRISSLGREPSVSGDPKSAVQVDAVAKGLNGTAERQDQPVDVNSKDLSQAVTYLNDFLQSADRSLRFTMNEKLGRVVIEIRNRETDELIRSIPPEAVIKAAERMSDLNGLLVKESA